MGQTHPLYEGDFLGALLVQGLALATVLLRKRSEYPAAIRLLAALVICITVMGLQSVLV